MKIIIIYFFVGGGEPVDHYYLKLHVERVQK